MLNKVKDLKGYKLHSLNGDIGEVKEFYFDDHHWTIRHLVADTGNWLPGRQVLISPYALVAMNKDKRYIAIDLTKEQIQDSPSLNSDQPVSRQFEESYYAYYGWPIFRTGPYQWGSYPYIVRDRAKWKVITQNEKSWDPNLRSTNAVSGHHIQAEDGEIGHVDDFIIDDDTWTIRYLIVDTRNWWLDNKVLISPQWIEKVSWDEKKVFINLSRENIKKSLKYSDDILLTRDYETGLHQHYNREGYWIDKPFTPENSY